MSSTGEHAALESIRRLKARYCRLLDSEDFAGFRSLFTADARFWVPAGDYADPEAFVAGVVERRRIAEVRSVHHVLMPELELLSGTTACGIWAMFDYIDRASRDGTRETFQGYGHYFESYRVERGEWRISSLRLTRIRMDFVGEERPPFPDRWEVPSWKWTEPTI